VPIALVDTYATFAVAVAADVLAGVGVAPGGAQCLVSTLLVGASRTAVAAAQRRRHA
jgi:hypothetical protein